MPRTLSSAKFGMLAWMLVALPHLIFVLSRWDMIPLHEGLPIGPTDPDPWLRLTLVRDWLLGGSWYSHAVSHTNTPWGGITSPWTRPLDGIIAGLVHLQPESVELNLRLMRAALMLPFLWMRC